MTNPAPDTRADAHSTGGWRRRSTVRASSGALTAIAAVYAATSSPAAVRLWDCRANNSRASGPEASGNRPTWLASRTRETWGARSTARIRGEGGLTADMTHRSLGDGGMVRDAPVPGLRQGAKSARSWSLP
jgi:hypothetical protein